MPLDGVRVLDLSRLLPGAYCTQLLQAQGAAVIKVESPTGDPIRALPGGEAYFDALHRGKQMLTLDLRSEAGRQALRRRVLDADVLVEGFRPGVMERMELGFTALAAINPALVYCAITGYGSDSPLARRAGHDLNYLARSGALALMPLRDGAPAIPGLLGADLAGGLYAAFLIAAALTSRGKTGRGQRLDVSMTDLMRSWTALPRAAHRAGLPGGVRPADRSSGLDGSPIRSGGDRGGPGDTWQSNASRMDGPIRGSRRVCRTVADARGSRRGLGWPPATAPAAYRQFVVVFANAGDLAEEAVLLLSDTGCEVQRVRWCERSAASASIAEPDSPETIDMDRGARLVPKGSDEAPRPRAVGVDTSVTEVADKQRPAEGPEVIGRQGQTPGRVQRPMLDQPAQQVAVQVEDVDEAEAGTGLVIVPVRLLHCIGHVETACQRLDIERREPGWDSRV